MKYKFVKKMLSNTNIFLIESEDVTILENFGVYDWTPSKAQEIIDGVVSTQNGVEKYEWANEDVHIASFIEGVFLFDLLARRGGKSGNGPDLKLSHNEFITFMKDFKKFIEENS